jgi:chromosome segregation ATPase
MSTIDERVDNLENRMSTVEAMLERITAAQEQNQTQLNTLTQRLDAFAQDNRALAQRLDSFIYESQRIARNTSERAERNEAAIEVLYNSTRSLVQSVERLENQFANYGQRTDSMISRLDALVNYLMRNN